METLHSFFWAAESSIKTELAFRKSKKVWKFPLVIFFHLQVGKEKQVPRIWRRSKSTWFANRFLPTFFHSNVISSFILDLSPNITICFTLSQVISAHGLGVLQGVCDRQRDDDGRTSHITVRTLGTWAGDIGMVRAMKKRHRLMVRAMNKKITIRSSLNEQWYSWSNRTKEVWKIFSIQKKSCCWIKLYNSKTVWLAFLSIHSEFPAKVSLVNFT